MKDLYDPLVILIKVICWLLFAIGCKYLMLSFRIFLDFWQHIGREPIEYMEDNK